MWTREPIGDIDRHKYTILVGSPDRDLTVECGNHELLDGRDLLDERNLCWCLEAPHLTLSYGTMSEPRTFVVVGSLVIRTIHLGDLLWGFLILSTLLLCDEPPLNDLVELVHGDPRLRHQQIVDLELDAELLTTITKLRLEVRLPKRNAFILTTRTQSLPRVRPKNINQPNRLELVLRWIRLDPLDECKVDTIVHPKVVALFIQREEVVEFLGELHRLDGVIVMHHILRLGAEEAVLRLLELLELLQLGDVIGVLILLHLDVIVLRRQTCNQLLHHIVVEEHIERYLGLLVLLCDDLIQLLDTIYDEWCMLRLIHPDDLQDEQDELLQHQPIFVEYGELLLQSFNIS